MILFFSRFEYGVAVQDNVSAATYGKVTRSRGGVDNSAGNQGHGDAISTSTPRGWDHMNRTIYTSRWGRRIVFSAAALPPPPGEFAHCLGSRTMKKIRWTEQKEVDNVWSIFARFFIPRRYSAPRARAHGREGEGALQFMAASWLLSADLESNKTDHTAIKHRLLLNTANCNCGVIYSPPTPTQHSQLQLWRYL